MGTSKQRSTALMCATNNRKKGDQSRVEAKTLNKVTGDRDSHIDKSQSADTYISTPDDSKSSPFSTAFARHRFKKDMLDLMSNRNALFLQYAHVGFSMNQVENTSACQNFSSGLGDQCLSKMSSTERSFFLDNRCVDDAENCKRLVNACDNLLCTIEPKQGIYSGVRCRFLVQLSSGYPFKAPLVRSTSRIFHPNVHPDSGIVDLAIIKEEWSPVLTLRLVVLGLVLALVEPDIRDAVNQEASNLLVSNKRQFLEHMERYKNVNDGNALSEIYERAKRPHFDESSIGSMKDCKRRTLGKFSTNRKESRDLRRKDNLSGTQLVYSGKEGGVFAPRCNNVSQVGNYLRDTDNSLHRALLLSLKKCTISPAHRKRRKL